MKRIIHLLRHGLFYTIAVSIEALAPFILAPFLTHYLSVYDYGIWAIFQSTCALLRPVLGLALDDFIRIRYHHTPGKIIDYIVSIVTLSTLVTLALCGLVMVFGEPFSHILKFPREWLWSMIACSWLYALFYIFLAYYQFESRRLHFTVLHFLQAVVTLACSVGLVMAGWGWHGAVLGKIAGLLCATVIAWLWLARRFPPRVWAQMHVGHLGELLAFGLRYMANGLVTVVVAFTNRIMLANVLSLQAASLFSVAALFPMVLTVGIRGYILGWQPWCFDRLARRDRSDLYELGLGAAAFLTGLPVAGLVLAWVVRWLGPYVIDVQFHQAFDYVMVLTMAMVMQGCYSFAQTILQYYQRLGLLSSIAAGVMVLNAILNMVLIQRMGIIGSGWATLITFTVAFLFTACVSVWHIRKDYFVRP